MSPAALAILVVDDNPVSREIAVEAFRRLGHDVFDAYNGEDALRLLLGHPEIGLLFADLQMWGMSGIALAEEARRIRPELEVVLTSGHPVEPRELPFRFVAKPWRLDELAAICDASLSA